MKKNEKGFGLFEGLLIIIILIILGLIGWYIFNKKDDKSSKKESSQSQSKTSTESKKEEAPKEDTKPKTGTIKGHASYPSEGLPPDEMICAQSVADPAAAPTCINVGTPQTINYEMVVPAGTYHVYATTGNMPGYKAYYNQFVVCGVSVDCPEIGHTQYIEVVVPAGGVVENVDPGDWYNF